MEENRSQLVENITGTMQQIAQTWKFDPGVWMELELTIVQLKSLFYIDFEGSTNFKNLAVALGVTPPSVTGIVDRLVEHGLVSREENPENRRMQVLKITEKGKAILTRLTESRRSRMAFLLDGLNLEDLMALSRILANISKSLPHSQYILTKESSSFAEPND
jgi:DNA-binding MarR family transcriptional regulator